MSVSEPPRFAVVSPYAATWLLQLLKRAGVDSRMVRTDAQARRARGFEWAADDLERSWRQLQAAERWHRQSLAGEPAVRQRPVSAPVSVDGNGETETVPVGSQSGCPIVAMDTAAAAARLGVTPRRVVQLLSAGLLEGQKVGRSWLVDPASVEAYELRAKGDPAA